MKRLHYLIRQFFPNSKPAFQLKKPEHLNLDSYRRAIIIHSGSNPTHHYYFKNCSLGNISIYESFDINTHKTLPQTSSDTLIIIIRYVNNQIIHWLDHHKQHGGRIVFFMDDDLPRNLYDSSLPYQYRTKLWQSFGKYLKALEQLCSELWISTNTLQNHYQHLPTRIISPSYQLEKAKEQIFYFYHGSPSTHREDIEWLRDVVQLTQNHSDQLSFMIIGDKHVKRLFAKIPRVVIIQPINWTTYQQTLPSLPHHIGLAPLVPTTFNATRSPTKFFDFTRMNAVGIYANAHPYKDFIHHNHDGILLDHDPKAWSQAIIHLATNQQQRYALLNNAKRRLY